MNELNCRNDVLVTLKSDELVRTILHGDKKLDNESNFNILTATVKFIKRTQRFQQPFLNYCRFAFSLCLNLCDKVFKF